MGLRLETLPNGEEVLVPLQKGASEASGALITLAANANTTREQMALSFSKGIENAKTLSDIFAMTKALDEFVAVRPEVGKMTTELGLVGQSFQKIFEQDLNSAKTVEELRAMAAYIEALGQKGVITEGQVTAAMLAIELRTESLAKTMAQQELSKPFNEFGISLEQLRTKTSEEGGRIALALRQIATDANATSAETQKAFAAGIDNTKLLGDLQSIADTAKNTLGASAKTFNEFQDVMAQVGTRFKTLFNEELSTARTREEFEQLREVASTMMKEGAISAQNYSWALSQIEEAASGAKAATLS